MPLYRIDTLGTRELFPGFTARLVHTPRVTQSFVEATAGSTFPEHEHPHEQVVTVLAGELELVVDGDRPSPHARHVLRHPARLRRIAARR